MPVAGLDRFPTVKPFRGIARITNNSGSQYMGGTASYPAHVNDASRGTSTRPRTDVATRSDHAANLISASIRIRSNGTHTPPFACRTSPNLLSALTSS